MDEEELEMIKSGFLIELKEKDIMKKILESKGFEHPIIQGQWLKYLQDLS